MNMQSFNLEERYILQDDMVCLPSGALLKERYIINKPLSTGGFSITYIAWDKTLEMKTIIKEYMPKEFLERKNGNTEIILKYAEYNETFNKGITQFLKEARILARFTHNHGIAGVVDYFAENNTAYIVMPYCEGMTLTEYVKRKGGLLEYRECMNLLLPVMKVLLEVHKEGVLHRDISPDNIFVTDSGRAVLLDFGASETIVVMNGFSVQKSPSTIKHGYAPPEQYCYNGIQGPWTDVYAMACTLYQCMGGKVPPPAVDRMHRDTIEPIRRLARRIPKHVEYALMKALNLASKDRYQDMNMLIDALTIRTIPVVNSGMAIKTAIAAILLTGCVFSGYLISENTQTIDTYKYLENTNYENKTAEENRDITSEELFPDDNMQIVIFKDKKLEAAIREIIGKESGDIMKTDISNIRTLDLSGKGIENLEGIQHFEQLSRLTLVNNMIEDIHHITSLKQLYHLDLGGNMIADISELGNCSFLSELDLHANDIEDISSLSGMIHINWLNLHQNNIHDVTPLRGLPKLKWLNIASNDIKDISCLSDCPRIEELVADDCGVKDIEAFKNMPNLKKLQY